MSLIPMWHQEGRSDHFVVTFNVTHLAGAAKGALHESLRIGANRLELYNISRIPL